MTTTKRPNIHRLMERIASNDREAERFEQAAFLVATLLTPDECSPLSDEVARLRRIAVDYRIDSADQWDELMEHYTPEQFEALVS
jgi:hypothetical protein